MKEKQAMTLFVQNNKEILMSIRACLNQGLDQRSKNGDGNENKPFKMNNDISDASSSEYSSASSYDPDRF